MMQPYCFPYIGYFQLINSVDKFVLYDNLNFIKEGWTNRNKYLVINDGPKYFNLLIKYKSSNKKIRDIKFIEGNYWRAKIEKSIYLNYKKAKYFDDIFQLIRKLLYLETDNLGDYNSSVISKICNYLEIDTKIINANVKYNGIEKEIVNEYKKTNRENRIDLKTYRIFKICQEEYSQIFINPIGGTSLYSKSIFSNYGIKLLFLKTQNASYKQINQKFEPNLSIIDVLLNCGRNGTKELLKFYDIY